MKRRIDKEKLVILWAANDAFKGTENYGRYCMYSECKCDGKYVYTGYRVPTTKTDFIRECYTKTIKTRYGEEEWLYVVERNDGIDRYILKQEVKALLGI